MRGAVAAGSRQAVDAGAWALREGGNAVDAAVAAALAAFVTEGPLTGPAAGGFLMLHRPAEGTTLLDAFFAVPAGGSGEMDEVVIDFGDASTQVFHVGDGSVAVPGLVAGLAEAHAMLGRLRWATLFAPALELAERGLDATPEQAFLHEILTAILQRDAGGRSIYGTPGRVVTADLVPTLRLLRDGGAEALPELIPEMAGDLEGYRVREHAPLESAVPGAVVLATPAPSRGGAVVARGLAALAADAHTAAGEDAAAAILVARALAAGYEDGAPGAKPTGTTHVSVVDRDRSVAAVSSTLGSGSGVFRHGFQLNNMLGEHDVIGHDDHTPGERLPSMMTPTLALVDGLPRLAVGSAGSVRLAGAILQVLVRVVAGATVADAIERPRLHVDAGTVHVEGGWSPRVADALEDEGWDVVRWADRNLFFGGTSGVELRPDGSAGAAGDPRRGGHGVVVP